MPTKFSQLEIAHWINRKFPPGSTQITNPGEFIEPVQLVQRVLPPTATLSRNVLRTELSVNPATTVGAPATGMPEDRFWWVHGCDFKVVSGALAAGNASHAFIRVRRVNGTADDWFTVGRGLMQPGDNSALVATHSIHFTSFSSPGGGGPGFFSGGGGGCGGFLVMPGNLVEGVYIPGPGIGTAVLGLTLNYIEFLLGEEIPSVG